MADTSRFGFEGGALVFGAALTAIAGLYYFTKISRTLLFWAAFILTRPLGATVGDLLDKPLIQGGFAIDRIYASAIIAGLIILILVLAPPKAGNHPEKS